MNIELQCFSYNSDVLICSSYDFALWTFSSLNILVIYNTPKMIKKEKERPYDNHAIIIISIYFQLNKKVNQLGPSRHVIPWLFRSQCSTNLTMKQQTGKFLPFHHTFHPRWCSSNWTMKQQICKFLPFHQTFPSGRCSNSWNMNQQIGKFLPFYSYWKRHFLNLNVFSSDITNQQNLSIAVCALLTMSWYYL